MKKTTQYFLAAALLCATVAQAGNDADDRKKPATPEYAAEKIRSMAEQGYRDAQYTMGLIYERGSGVKQDYAEAMKWYRRSAEQGKAWGAYNVGMLYLKGLGVEQSDAEAVKWIRKAAELGLDSAREKLDEICGRKTEACATR